MKTKKTTRTIEISIQTDEHLVIRQRRNVTRAWCERCAKETSGVRLEEIGEVAGTLEKPTDDKRLHYIETADGFLVCLNSVD